MEPPNDSPPLVQKIGATSIAEIEKLIRELQETKNFLQSEADRIERETARYMNLTQMASASVKIIFDAVSGWRQAGHPMRNFAIMGPPGTPFRDEEMIALVRACGTAAKIGSTPR